MKFYVVETSVLGKAKYPFGILRRDNWDDFGFKTTFHLTVYISTKMIVELGDVKIFCKTQSSGSTQFEKDTFSRLGVDYCSLGQSLSYYEKLLTLEPVIRDEITSGLRDVVASEEIRVQFSSLHGFKTSLLRSSSAERVLMDGPALLSPTLPTGKGSVGFIFKTSVGGSDFETLFDFTEREALPNQLIAIIGYNGSGKTQLLSNLAYVAHLNEQERARLTNKRAYGSLSAIAGGEVPVFGSVVMISYSAFDTFVVPGRTGFERERVAQTGELFGYRYCGLRTYGEAIEVDSTAGPDKLLTVGEIEDAFARALTAALSADRKGLFIGAVGLLLREPSIGQFFSLDSVSNNEKAWRTLFRVLSAGHKITFNIVAQLAGHMQRRSLVLIDEPETHLHPPLLAALLRSIRFLLQGLESYAVVATHSPVVLQETPARFVKMLRRIGAQTVCESTEIETFGEDIGAITSNVFHLNNSLTDFHNILDELRRTKTKEQIMALFDNRLGFTARSYLNSPDDISGQ